MECCAIGAVTEFDDPDNGGCTEAAAINMKGTVAGFDAFCGQGISHSFIRSMDGKFTEFRPNSRDINQSSGINDDELVTGLTGLRHFRGFLWHP